MESACISTSSPRLPLVGTTVIFLGHPEGTIASTTAAMVVPPPAAIVSPSLTISLRIPTTALPISFLTAGSRLESPATTTIFLAGNRRSIISSSLAISLSSLTYCPSWWNISSPSLVRDTPEGLTEINPCLLKNCSSLRTVRSLTVSC